MEKSVIIALIVVAVVLVVLAIVVMAYVNHVNKTRQREIDLMHQNIEFEMKFLKSQINPHFLFNAMNNIYALSIIKSERTPEMILKLSDMLRFTLYESENKKVKVGREVDYIINFIEFQKIKMDSEPNIRVDISNCNKELMIEPMLLVPFIENSFKHGNIDNTKKGWLQVEIKTLGPMLVFQVANSLPSIAINKDVVGGIGVENVRKRLDMLYPGRYELSITTDDSEFRVFMKIDTFIN
ncbi:MAG: sensor histidine kinase [Bacteroidales bacterium]|nr:sensor histidine kinase [Bacteroidales bacterium]